jgi:hypothetical protein
VTLLAATCRHLARLATWSAAVLTDTADQLTRAAKRAHDTKDYR